MIWVKKSKQKGAMIIVTSDSLNTFVPGTSLESYACTAQLHFLFYEGNYVSCGFAVSTFCLGSWQGKIGIFCMFKICHKN